MANKKWHGQIEHYGRGKNRCKKPPLGVHSRHIWELQRIEALTGAINRFKQEGLSYPKEWDAELHEITAKLKSEGKFYCD